MYGITLFDDISVHTWAAGRECADHIISMRKRPNRGGAHLYGVYQSNNCFLEDFLSSINKKGKNKTFFISFILTKSVLNNFTLDKDK